MKLTHVFGLVVSVHLVALTFVVSTPGCRSTGKQKPRPEDTDVANANASAVTPVDPVAPAPVESMGYDDINAPAPGYDSPSYGQGQQASTVSPVASTEASGSVRFAPTRPAPGGATEIAPVAPPVAATATHTVVSGDSLWSIARKHDISVAELAAANQLAPSATLRIGQTLTVPAAPVGLDASSGMSSDAANTYTVVSGDTLGGIARKQGTTVSALRAANNLSGDMLHVGQKLVLPADATGVPAPASTSSGSGASVRAGSGTYTVVPGDTLGAIARRHGVKVGDIALLNNITDPAKLRVGQVLKLPAGAASVSTPAAPARSVAPATTTRPAAPAPVVAPPRQPEPAVVTPAPVESFPATSQDPSAITPVEPVEPVAPVDPVAVPVIRIE